MHHLGVAAHVVSIAHRLHRSRSVRELALAWICSDEDDASLSPLEMIDYIEAPKMIGH